MKKILYIFTLLCISSYVSLGQTYTLNANLGSISTCSGNFFDSGGSGGNYGNGQNFTVTFCSSTPGQQIFLNFSAFNIESGFDFLSIYNGANTAAPLIGTFTGTTSPGTVNSTNGCLTVVFTTDGSVTASGLRRQLAAARLHLPLYY